MAAVLIGQFVVRIGESVDDTRKINAKHINKVLQNKKHHHKLNWMLRNGNYMGQIDLKVNCSQVTKRRSLWYKEDG